MTFPLFSGENHYGILLCDAEPEDISSAYTYSLTLGSVLRFMQISKAEKLVQNKKNFEIQKEKLGDLINLDVSTGYTFSNPYISAEIPRTALEELIQYTLENL